MIRRLEQLSVAFTLPTPGPQLQERIRHFKYHNHWHVSINYATNTLTYSDKPGSVRRIQDPDLECETLLSMGYTEIYIGCVPNANSPQGFDGFNRVTPKRIQGKFELDCSHVYVSYTGLNETFMYCKICDHKKA